MNTIFNIKELENVPLSGQASFGNATYDFKEPEQVRPRPESQSVEPLCIFDDVHWSVSNRPIISVVDNNLINHIKISSLFSSLTGIIPNPSNGLSKISFDGRHILFNRGIYIFSGTYVDFVHNIYKGQITENNTTLTVDFPTLPGPGTYIIRLDNQGNFFAEMSPFESGEEFQKLNIGIGVYNGSTWTSWIDTRSFIGPANENDADEIKNKLVSNKLINDILQFEVFIQNELDQQIALLESGIEVTVSNLENEFAVFQTTINNDLLAMQMSIESGLEVALINQQEALDDQFATFQAEIESGVEVTINNAIDSLGFTLNVTGMIMMWGGITAPSGWVLADGTSYLRAGTYAPLFAIIGTSFGSTDSLHFSVPDMRGIFVRGASNIAVRSFTNAMVNSGEVTFGSPHGYNRNGIPVRYNKSGNDITNLIDGTTYYVFVDPSDPLTIKLCSSEINAWNGNGIGIISGGSGTYTLTCLLDPDATSRVPITKNGHNGDMVGSFEADAFASHSHNIIDVFNPATQPGNNIGSTNNGNPTGLTPNVSQVGGNETRPKNIYVNYIIKI